MAYKHLPAQWKHETNGSEMTVLFWDIFIYQMLRNIALSTLVGEYWRHLPHLHYKYLYIKLS